MGYFWAIVILISSLSVKSQSFTLSDLAWQSGRRPNYFGSFWLMANQGVYTNAGIGLAITNTRVWQWNDQSGTNNVVILSVANTNDRPFFLTNILNGLPVVRFYQTNQLAGPMTITIPSTFVILMRIQVTNIFQRVLFGSGFSGFFVDQLANGQFTFAGGSQSISTQISTNQWHIITCIVNGVNSKLNVDGVERAIGNVDTDSSINAVALGGSASNTNGVGPLDLAEIMWTNNVPNLPNVYTYLSNKWGL